MEKKKRPPITISTEEIRARALVIIECLPLTPVHEVIIREKKRDRSSAQNSLLWVWYGVISKDLGETEDDLHYRYKKKFLVAIYERDDDDYRAMIQAVREVYTEGKKTQARAMEKQIVKLTSTTTASVEQFTEYLNKIEQDVAPLGIRLPNRDDLYFEAMGIRKGKL
jgi:hypothetical protein